MREASKTRAIRSADFYKAYLGGKVLDIGAGDDLCVPHAVPFDKDQGDANDILKHIPPETFDCVHSSHCLEHVFDPAQCLRDWWAVVKPGGFLITVVPDEDFYEQGNWPSLFNPDHKSTFRLDGASSWSPVSFCLPALVASLPGARIVSAERQTEGYFGDRFLLAKRSSGRLYQKPANPSRVRHLKLKVFTAGGRWIRRAGLANTFAERIFITMALVPRSPVDQTLGNALAQIEVVAHKEARRA
jgi:SAM-dependent methyltransferase